MSPKQRTAVELLVTYPEATVAEMLGIRVSTLARWMQDAEFVAALRAREHEQNAALSRIARQAALRAAASLCQMTGDESRPDPKILMELLKASGAFEQSAGDPAAAVAEAIRLAAKTAEETDEQQTA